MTWASGAALVSSALLFAFGTGLSPVAALAWFAPLPVLLLAPRVSTRRLLVVTGASYVLSTIGSWSFYAQSSDTPLWPIGTVIIAAFAVTLMLAVWVFRRLVTQGRVISAMLTTPAVWTGVLFLISISNPMGIMGTLATTQADIPAVVQIASITGWTGVEYFVFFVATALASLLSSPAIFRVRLRAGVVAAGVVVLALGVGSLLSAANGPDGETRQIAVIAHNESPWGVDAATSRGRELMESYAAEIADLPADTETVVLPEGAFLVDDTSEATLTERFARTARSNDVTVAVAYNRVSQDTKFNTARIIPAGGGEPVSYLKHHDTVSELGDTLIHQPDTQKRVGVQICADINFSDPSRDYAQSGARLMLLPASDNGRNGWQHSRTALLRGVENGFAVAWAGRDGQSMIANGNGHVLADARTSGADSFTTLVADVDDGPGATLYTELGDWFAWLSVLLGTTGIGVSYLRPRCSVHTTAAAAARGESPPASQLLR